ncbi:ChaC-domain-containing protein [Xylariaceae sp. FL0594]|nr:ChaC-domain-containing protein [Xylariaceae sp. FL0594]
MSQIDGIAPDADLTHNNSPSEEFWIFGYGSLIWKPPPHYDRRIPGWVTGYVRRFWQASQDHRGTPTAPGRVVTLIERSFWSSLADAHDEAPERVWGVAYRIESARVAEVKEYLDIREINGYTIHYTPFHPSSTATSSSSSSSDPTPTTPFKTLVYIGTPENDQFVGPQDPQALAEHIYSSRGPSGLNRDYLLELEKALAELGPESGDAHVTDLSNRLREIERTRGRAHLVDHGVREAGAAVRTTDLGDKDGEMGEKEGEPQEDLPHKFAKVTSIDEQEETEKA